jgi:hypothetical protein
MSGGKAIDELQNFRKEVFFLFFFILIPNYICNLFKNIQQKV